MDLSVAAEAQQSNELAYNAGPFVFYHTKCLIEKGREVTSYTAPGTRNK